MKNTRYLAECGDSDELMDKIEELEARIAALEGGDECEDGECDDEVCPECGQNPCVCDDEECADGECEDDPAAAEDETDEEGVIDNEDVEEIEELDFSKPHFLSNDSEDEENDEEYDGGLHISEADPDEDEEDSPYFN